MWGPSYKLSPGSGQAHDGSTMNPWLSWWSFCQSLNRSLEWTHVEEARIFHWFFSPRGKSYCIEKSSFQKSQYSIIKNKDITPQGEWQRLEPPLRPKRHRGGDLQLVLI